MNEKQNIVSHTDAINAVRGTSQYAVDQLRERVFSGQYAPNSLLPSQRKLAEELGVGHWGIRMALEELIRDGLVESIPGQGTRVLPAEKLPVQTKVAFIHTPVKAWCGAMEPVHIREGVSQRLRALGYLCVDIAWYNDDLQDSCSRLDVHTAALDDLAAAAEGCEGFVFMEAGELISEFILDLERRKIPMVVANLEFDLPVSGTCLDHVGVSVRAVETLASFGHKRIAYLGASPDLFFYGKALEGFRSGMQAAGLPVDESLIAFSEVAGSSLSAYQACKPLLHRSDPPTAIVAARDSMAAGACHAIEEAGLEVGRDISVVGFDDVSWDRPEQVLTTFHEPCAEMGSVAVDMLSDRLRNGWCPSERRMIDAPLVLRRSAGPPPMESEKK